MSVLRPADETILIKRKGLRELAKRLRISEAGLLKPRKDPLLHLLAALFEKVMARIFLR